MTPYEQQGATIANLIAAIDGSITRVCVDCGCIFKLHAPRLELGSFCPDCREKRQCCDSPDLRTVAGRQDDNGNGSITKACVNCGLRIELES